MFLLFNYASASTKLELRIKVLNLSYPLLFFQKIKIVFFIYCLKTGIGVIFRKFFWHRRAAAPLKFKTMHRPVVFLNQINFLLLVSPPKIQQLRLIQ